MRMVAAIVSSAVASKCPSGARGGIHQTPSGCEMSLVEGGPHFGDCSLWAAAMLKRAGIRLRALAFEPLPDASALFRQSTLENGFASEVAVRTAALGSTSDSQVEMIHFHGHNVESAVRGDDFISNKPEEVTVVPNVPQVTLDEEVPTSWAAVDVLKLSVNGAERETLRGARQLLSQRRICSVLMHTQKAARGREATGSSTGKSAFSADLLQLLVEGDMDIFTHRDQGPEGGPVHPATTPADLDRVFDDPKLSQKDYILARSRASHCELARRHFGSAYGQNG